MLPVTPAAYDWRRYLLWYLAIPLVGLVASGIAMLGSGPTSRPLPARLATQTSPAATKSRQQVDDLVEVLPVGQGVLVTIRIDADNREPEQRLARFDVKNSAMLWRSEPLSKERLRSDNVTAAVDAVYVADETRLIALRLENGAVIWRASLTAELAAGCGTCLKVIGNRLLALQKDGSLQAFDTESGRLTWGIRLKDTPRELIVAGDRILVRQPPERTDNKRGRGRHSQFNLLDPADGRTTLGIQPRCRSLRTFPDEQADVWSPRLLSPDGKSMYVQFGNFRHCTQRWDLAAGKMVWGINLADSPGKLALLTATSLFLDADKAVRVLDIHSGALRTLISDDDHKLHSELVRDDLVVVSAIASWDSSRKNLALWGLEPATGQRLWQYTARSAERSWSHTAWWTVRSIGQSVMVAQFLDGDRLAFDSLDGKTGVNAGRKIIAVRGNSWSAWQDGIGWLDAGSDLYAIDLAGGRIAYHVR